MNETTFKQIVIEHQDRVYNTCLGFLKNPEDAEDMAQEVFIKVYNAYDNFLGKAQLSTWVYKIAVNLCIEEIRKKKASKRFAWIKSINKEEDELKGDFMHPGVSLENKEHAQALFAAIEQLPETQQIVFNLSKLEGLSSDEIAAIVDKSKSSVESLMHRAKLNLKDILKKYYEREFN